jgi:hypothetical protein
MPAPLLALASALFAAPPAPPVASSTASPPAPDAAAAALQAELMAADRDEGGFLERLQYDVVVASTVRWQVDNGESSEFFNAVDGDAPMCTVNEDCGPGAVCFEGRCRTPNNQYDPSGENFGDFVSTFGGSLRYEELVATARFDVATYFRAPEAAPSASDFIRDRLTQRYEDQLRAEYLSVAYAGENIELTLGDYYVTLGRGLTLGVRIVDDVAVDNKLRGGEAKAHAGPFDIHIFYGLLNIKNFEPGTGFAYEETGDQIGGARFEWNLGRALKLGIHGARIRTPVISDQQTEFLNVGATLEMPRPVDWASVYAEVAHLDRNRFIGQARQLLEQEGFGLYGNINLFFGPMTFLLEGKAYDNMFSILPGDASDPLAQRRQNINRLSEPPTAERFGATILSNQTVFGGRVRADWSVTPEIVPYVSYGHYVDGGCGLFGFRGRSSAAPGDTCDDATSVGANVRPKSFVNAVFGGIRARWSKGDISAEAGYRGQFFYDAQTASPDTLSLQESHGQLDLHQRFGRFNAELFLLAKALAQIDNDWVEGRAALSLGHAEGWSVTAAYEYTTISPNSREHYPSLSGQVQLSDAVLLRGLVGGERPGLKCSGGACRFFPGFEGGRLELTVRL